MSNIKELKQPPVKSKQIIMDCLRRMLKLARQRNIVLCAMVFIGADGKIHIDRIGPVNHEQRDQLLDAVEELHESIHTAID